MEKYIEGNKAAWEEAFDKRDASWGADITERILKEEYPFFEKEMVEQVLPILKAESEYYKKEIAKLPLLPKEERIHLSGYLTKLINEEKKYGINEKILKENKRAASKGLDDKLSHRAALIEIAKDKERTFRGIAETVLSSITEQDKKELY